MTTQRVTRQLDGDVLEVVLTGARDDDRFLTGHITQCMSPPDGPGRAVPRLADDPRGARVRDTGPAEIVAGAVDAASDTVQPVIVGPHGLDTQGLELIEAPDVIAMDEKPTDAVRAKPNSSLVVASAP